MARSSFDLAVGCLLLWLGISSEITRGTGRELLHHAVVEHVHHHRSLQDDFILSCHSCAGWFILKADQSSDCTSTSLPFWYLQTCSSRAASRNLPHEWWAAVKDALVPGACVSERAEIFHSARIPVIVFASAFSVSKVELMHLLLIVIFLSDSFSPRVQKSFQILDKIHFYDLFPHTFHSK